MFCRKVALVAVLACVLSTQAVYAFGSKRSTPPAPTPVPDSQAYPARTVQIGSLYDAKFYLPDGKTQVDSGMDIQGILLSAAAGVSPSLRISGLAPDANGVPAGTAVAPAARFVLHGGITAFEANLTDWNITFGYNAAAIPGSSSSSSTSSSGSSSSSSSSSSGDIGNGTALGLSGQVQIQIGDMQVDFYIEDTQENQVAGVGSASASTLNLNLTATVDFDSIEAGTDFTKQPDIASIYRAVVTKALQNMMNDPRTNFLMYWQSSVATIDTANNILSFNAGLLDNIAVGNLFQVYAGTLPLGEIRVNTVGNGSSQASYKNDPAGAFLRSTQIGDPIQVYFQTVPK